MLFHLLYPLSKHLDVLRLFNYITFRAAGAFVTALMVTFLVGPSILRRLRAMQVHQGVREGTPETHAGKGMTPTMGGLIILAATIVPTLLWAKLNNRYVVLALVVTAWMGAIGFVDDYLKLKQRREGRKNRGLIERYKLTGQVTLGLFLGWYLWQHPVSTLPGASTTLPFFKYVLVVPAAAGLAWLYVLFVTFVLTGVSNAVNLTDGLDGLAIMPTVMVAAGLGIFAYVMGHLKFSAYLGFPYIAGSGEMLIFCGAIVGAGLIGVNLQLLAAYLLLGFANGLDNPDALQQPGLQPVAKDTGAVLLAHEIVMKRRSGFLGPRLVLLLRRLDLDHTLAGQEHPQNRRTHVVDCLGHIGEDDLRTSLHLVTEWLGIVIAISRLLLGLERERAMS